MPYKFNVENFDKTGLDVLFYGQEHYDTMAIIEDDMKVINKKNLGTDTIGEMLKNQKLLGNREVMLKNFQKLIESLSECEDYITNVVDGKQIHDTDTAQMINQCMSQFQDSEMSILEKMILTNLKDGLMTNNIAKLQTQ